MKIFKFCNKYIYKYKGMFSIYIILNIVIGLLGIITPLVSGNLINNLTYLQSKEILIKYSILFVVLNIFNMLIGFLSSHLYVKLQTKIGYSLNKYVIDHLQNLSLSYFIKTDTIYLNQRINNDSNNIIIFSIGVIINVVVNLLTIIFTSLILMKINYKVAVIMFVLVIIYIFIYIIFKNPLYKIAFEVKEAQSGFFSRLNEQLSYIKFIKTHSISSIFISRLDNSFNLLINKLISSQKLSYLYSGCDTIIGLLAQLCIYLVGGFAVINGQMKIGFFVIMSNYFSMMLNSARYFFNLGKTYQDNLVSYNRINEILSLPIQKNGKVILNKIDSIKLDRISFKYGEKKIFSDLSINFNKGKTYNIIGQNGAGKSTLIALILGLYSYDYKGTISFNDIDIKDVNMFIAKFKTIGVTEQEPTLIPDTLLNNITLGAPYDTEMLNELIEVVGLKNYIQSLENGINTIINDKSSNISGGEKQKISILRQFLKDPDVMIFDEPTSALDKESKYKFINHLNKIKCNRIIIIISHDSFINTICDEVINLTDVLL